MSQTVFGAEAVVSILNRAFTNTSPSNLIFQNQVNAAGNTEAGQLAFAAQFGRGFASLVNDAAALTNTMITNFGLSSLSADLLSVLRAEVTAIVEAVPPADRGIVVLQLAQLLSSVEGATGDLAAFSPLAAAWNQEVTASYTYSVNPANTTTGDPLADATAPVVTAATISYTENQVADAVLGTVGATDNSGSIASYEIKSGNADNYFAIDNTGKVTITAAGVAAHANNFESGVNTASLVVVAKDAAGNTSAETTIVLNETNVGEFTTGAAAGTTVKLNFDAALKSGITVPTGDFFVTQGTSSFAVTKAEVAGTTVTLTLASAVAATGDVSVNYTGTALVDANNVAVAKQVMKAVPGDITAPTATLSPVDGATAVAATADIVLTFDEAVTKGAGNITLTNAADATQVVTIDVASSQVTLSADGKTVTINPTADLAAGVQYNVVVPSGSFKDVAGNNYGGSTAYDFTTATAQQTTTYDLTTGADVRTANLFNAYSLVSVNGAQIDTLQSTDNLTGTGTNPTLNATIASAVIATPTLAGVETVNLTVEGAARTLNLSKATGVKTVSVDASQQSLTLQGVANAVELQVKNGADVGGGTEMDTLALFADTVVAGAADVAKVALTSNGGATVASDQLINLRGTAAGGFETLEITATGTNRIAEILSDAAVGLDTTATGTNAVRTIKVSGDGSLRVQNNLTSTTTFDASANKGGVNVGLNNAGNVTVTGGEGNDTFNLIATLTNADKINGGAGRNTLATTNAITVGHQISNIQILRNDGAGAATVFDNDDLTSVDTINHSSANTATYQDMVGANAADATKGLTLQGVGVATFNIKGATGLGGNSDALYVNVGSATGTTGVNIGGGAAASLTTVGTEKVTANVVANNTTANTAAQLTITGDAATSSVVINGGAAGVAFTQVLAGTGAALTSVDGSTFVGNLTVAGNAFAQVIKGGSGNDVISTGGHAAFADGVSSDVLTGNSGTDTFAFATADTAYTAANLTTLAASTNDGYSELTTITDLNLGGAVAGTAVDQISFAAVGGANVAATLGTNANTVQVVNGGAAVALTGATFGAAVNALFVTGGVLDTDAGASVLAGLFTWGGETFLIAGEDTSTNDGFAGGVAGSDIVIRVTGVTGALDAGDFAAF